MVKWEIGDGEEYREVPGTDGRYLVSNFGNIVSLYIKRNNGKDTYSPRKIKGCNNGNGYLYFDAMNGGKVKRVYIHRAVAEAFIPAIEGKQIVNHRNFKRDDNNVSNLEWCTQRENVNHSKERYCHAKSTIKANTGYKYISLTKKGVYRVSSRQRGIDKRFKTLEEAILYRNEAMHEICFAK